MPPFRRFLGLSWDTRESMSDDLGTTSIGTRLLLGILVPDSLRKVGGRWVKVGGSRESMLDDLVTWLIQVHHVCFFFEIRPPEELLH